MLPLIYFVVIIAQVSTEFCQFEVNANTPIITTNDFKFPETLEIQSEDELYIICPTGRTNPKIAAEGDHVVCQNGTNILNLRTIEILDFAQLECTAGSNLKTQISDQKCFNDNTIIETGIKIKNKIVPEITVCFDTGKLSPFYAKHKLTGSVRNLSGEWSYDNLICGDHPDNCPFYDGANIFSNANVNLNDIYQFENQRTFLASFDINITDSNKLVPVPLSLSFFKNLPQSVQSLAYFEYTNTVPLWKDRFSAVAMDTILSLIGDNDETSYVGTLGVATGGDDDKEIYLSDTKLPVPKWYWIVSYQNNIATELVFIYNNFSLRNIADDSNKLCNKPITILFLMWCELKHLNNETDLVNFRDGVLCVDNYCKMS